MIDQNLPDVPENSVHDILDLNTALDSSAVDEHAPIFEELINELKVELDF